MTDRPFVESLFERAYRARGLRGAGLVAMGGVAVFAPPWAILSESADMIIAGGTGRDLVLYVAVTSVFAAAAVAIATGIQFRDFATIERWERAGRPASEAAQVQRLAVTGPMRWTSWGMVLFLVPWSVISGIWFHAVSDSLAIALLLVFGGITMASVAVWPLSAFLQELAVRPWLVGLWEAFPDLPAPELPMQSLRARFLLPVPLLTLPTGFVVGLLVAGFDRPFVQAAVALVAGLTLTIAFAAFLRMAAGAAVLRPVERLVAGVEQVMAGDMSARVPITTTDELATLSRAFNTMAERLGVDEREVRASQARIVAATDEARRRIERNLHDGAQQYLVIMELKLGMLERELGDDPVTAQLATQVKRDLESALGELREVAHGLYPAILEADGLLAALKAAADRSAIPVIVAAGGVGRVPSDVESAVYFCCLEAMQNAGQYAGKDARVLVELSRKNGSLNFAVSDDGRGFDPALVPGGIGRRTMADRIGALGGSLEIESAPGKGTAVSGSVPVAQMS